MTNPHTIVPNAENGWVWHPQPEAQKLVDDIIAEFLDRNPKAAELAERMTSETGTRFKDWVDSLHIQAGSSFADRLESVGYREDTETGKAPGIVAVYRNPLGLFPPIATFEDTLGDSINLAIKVESVTDFLQTWQVPAQENVGGKVGSRTRWAWVWMTEDPASEFWVIERHGYDGYHTTEDSAETRLAAIKHLENFRTRKRDFGVGAEADLEGFAETNRLIDLAIEDLGQDWAADLFFKAEREYWQQRNRAARVQYARQQSLGLGWANHDHHTYRVSRQNYQHVIAIFEKLGFYCREKFFAGAEAGWGAQVLEQPVCGVVIFADVDMAPDEIDGDFPHKGFSQEEGFHEKEDLHTVGLWCGLHGEAILQAGMHHLECQFDWHALKAQLAEESVGMMDPFTTFPFLRQAFTEGEQWRVQPERVRGLEQARKITGAEAEKFLAEGARGSHLENLERNDGFKGFNQQGVSDIIARTDARRG